MESKVFWGVLCALLVFSGLCWLVFALGVFGVRVAASQAAQQAQQAQEQVAQQAIAQSRLIQAQEVARERYEQQRQVYEASRYLLAVNQQCVGGAVVQVDGTTYTQVGSIAQPVHCVGRRADRPLR